MENIMPIEAIAIKRVSSKRQEDGHSLESQDGNIEKVAVEKATKIVKSWTITKSRRKGKEIKKKDLEEALEYCKRHKNIKFFYFDRLNRFMREVDMFYYYIVAFKIAGVTVWFCSPDQQDLNGDDQISQLKRFLYAYEAENDNRERSQTIIIKMKSRYQQGYWPSNSHQGYVKGKIKAIHEPDQVRSNQLQQSAMKILSREFTVSETHKWLDHIGYRTPPTAECPKGNRLKIDKFKELMCCIYYAGIVEIPKWEIFGVPGLHYPLWTLSQHYELVAIVKGQTAKHKMGRHHNADYPMANLLRTSDCNKSTTVSGFLHKNGKPSHKGIEKYCCKSCRKTYRRDDIHNQIDECIARLDLSDKARDRLALCLEKIRRSNQQSNLDIAQKLEDSKESLVCTIPNLIIALSDPTNAVIKADILDQLGATKVKIAELEQRIHEARDIDHDLVDFIQFSLKYVSDIKDNWWKLNWEDKERCEQVLFPGGLHINSDGKISHPQKSQIFTLLKPSINKKEPAFEADSHLVELRGIAPRSARLLASALQA
jgi:hypothetical protein